MKKLGFLSATMLIVLSSVGFAADLPSKKAPAVMADGPLAFSWTGAYVGASVGIGADHSTFDYQTPNVPSNGNGSLFGIQAGYNYQMGSFVAGLEANADIVNIRGSAPCPGPSYGCRHNETFNGALRGRLGFAGDRFLAYVTGGVAFANIRERAVNSTLVSFGQTKGTTGWTLGAGVEYAFTNHWSVGLEYAYSSYGAKKYIIDGGTVIKAKVHSNVVKVGVNYHF